MVRPTSALGQQSAIRVVLLSLLVAAHFVCSICHFAIASADAAGTDGGAVQTAAVQADTAPSLMAMHDSEDGADGTGTDQRFATGKLLMLLALGMTLIAALWTALPRPSTWPIRRSRAAACAGPRLLVSLCVQRV